MTTPALTLRFGSTSRDSARRVGWRERFLRIARHLSAAVQRVSPERWWLLLFASLFAAFFIALLFQPGIGRGGR